MLVGERRIQTLPLNDLRSEVCYFGPATLSQRFASYAYRRLNIQAPHLVSIIRSLAPKLIHAHFGFDGVEAWSIAKTLKIPLVVTLHGSDVTTSMQWFSSGSGGRRWKKYPIKLTQLCGERDVHFLAVSENTKNAALMIGVPEERLFVSHIGINLSKYPIPQVAPSARQPTVLFVGRLVERRGAAF